MLSTPVFKQGFARRYQVREQLGAGAMGTVYRAFDRLTGQAVALKRVQVTADQLVFQSRQGSTHSPRLALAHEFQTLASLRHPNIVSVLDYGFEGEQPFFTMTLLERPQTLVEAGRGLPLSDKAHLLIQMLQALSYVHRRGLLHRDLKPGNVLVVGGHVSVVDFGLALDRTAAQTGEAVGTLAYISPEALMGSPINEAADLYAVGVMAYELFGGEHPYAYSDVMQIINAVLHEPVNTLKLDLPEALQLILWRLLVKDPQQRYASADAVIAALRQALSLPLPPETHEIRESFLQAAAFVGREVELGLLTDALHQITRSGAAASEQGTGWLIGGESGVGKSRLLSELRNRALVEGALVLVGQAVSDGPLPYQLWRSVLRRAALHVTPTPEDAAVLRMIVPDIDTLLGQSIPDVPAMDVDVLHRRLQNMVERLLRDVAGQQPVLIILEDLQWAGTELRFLNSLTQLVRELPLMIVGNYRHDERPDLPAELPNMRLILLERLKDQEIARLSALMLGTGGQRQQVISFLQKQTEGNIFFLIEVVRALAEDAGQLTEVGFKTLPTRVFAGGMQRVVRHRLERVPAFARPMVNLAAVIGRYIDLALIAHLDPQLNIDEWLTTMVNAAIIDFQEGRWRFAHDKLREAALEALPAAHKQTLHGQVAQAIEVVYEERLDDYAGVLAAHWAAAGSAEKEGRYVLKAGWQAVTMNDYRRARQLFERTLELRVHAQQPDPRKGLADVYFALGRACYGLSDYDEARGWQVQALDLYREVEDALGVAEAISALGELDFRQGHFAEALPLVEDSLRRYEALNARQKMTYALMSLGVIAARQGRMADAQQYAHDAVVIMREIGEPVGLARALNNYGISFDMQGDLPRARELYGESLAIRRRINDREGIAFSLANLGALLELEGDLAEAERHLNEAIYLLRQIGNKSATASGLALLSGVLSKQQQYLQAGACLNESLAIRQTIGDQDGITNALTMLAQNAQALGETTQAWEYLRQALERLRDREPTAQSINTLHTAADWLASVGRVAEAVGVLAFLMVLKQAKGSPTTKTEERLEALRGRLTPGQFAEAEAMGAAQAFSDVVERLLRPG